MTNDGRSTVQKYLSSLEGYYESASQLGRHLTDYVSSKPMVDRQPNKGQSRSRDDSLGHGASQFLSIVPSREPLEAFNNLLPGENFAWPTSYTLPDRLYLPNDIIEAIPMRDDNPLVAVMGVFLFLGLAFYYFYKSWSKNSRGRKKKETGTPPRLRQQKLGISSAAERHAMRRISSPDRLSRMNFRAGSGAGKKVARVQNVKQDRPGTFDFFGMNDGIGEQEIISRSRSNSLVRGCDPRQRKRTLSLDFFFDGLASGRKGSFGSDKGRANNKRLLPGEGPLSMRSTGEENFYNFSNRDDFSGGMLYDEFGRITLSSQLSYHGPSCCAVTYSVMTPPTSIARKKGRSKDKVKGPPPTPTSKTTGRLLASEIALNLHRDVVMDINKSTLSFVLPNPTGASKRFDFSRSIPEFSTHVVPPAEGGVLNVYILGSPKEEWMEYTFHTAYDAAQFQLDLIAYQVMGPSLRNMYQVLSLVHQGSPAHDGQEFVIHDDHQINDASGNAVDKAKKTETKSEGESGVDKEGQADSLGDTTKSAESSKHSFINAGIAWDDAMRALSSIPSVRIALERLWLHHRNHGFPATGSAISAATRRGSSASGSGKRNSMPTSKMSKTKENTTETTTAADASNPSDAHQGSLTEEYINKRLLLGPVDFFRLFVPTLPETAVPQTNESNKDRMDQLLRWRKRVARAAVLVRAYTLSRRVVSHGWTIPVPPTFSMPSHVRPFRKRLAYDDNEDNNRRDFTSKNEYYEATVSRDVLCLVRPEDYFLHQDVDKGSIFWRSWGGNSSLVLSPCQAFSLVAVHAFKLPEHWSGDDPSSFPLHPSRDPVAVIPSLYDLINKHPEADFFLTSFYPKNRNTAIVQCYVRSLPKGIDPAFDTVMDRFTNGSKETRDQKLHLMIQLGPYLGLSFAGWAVLRILSFLLSLTRKGRECPTGYETTRDRSPFPAIRLMNYSKTYHFGGSLKTDMSMPRNYIAVNAYYDSMHMPNALASLLFWNLEHGSLSKNILDFSFVLEGEQPDELPERALSTIRLVHVESEDIALPVSVSANWIPRTRDGKPTPQADGTMSRQLHRVTQKFQSMAAIFGSPLRPRTLSSSQRADGPHGQVLPELSEEVEEDEYNDGVNYVQSDDPVEMAANLVTEILSDTVVPVRKDQLHREDSARIDKSFDDTESNSSSLFPIQSNNAIVPVSILSRIRRDEIKRFLRASDFDTKVAAVRLVETAAWRGITFPIDKRRCRVELQNGQFFQQGKDFSGNPVCYFRNMCLGPWRGNIEAAISAVLYRLDKVIQECTKSRADAQCLLIVLLGRPYGNPISEMIQEENESQGNGLEKSGSGDEAENDHDGAASTAVGSQDATTLGDMTLGAGHDEARQSSSGLISNPRIDPEESWQVHSNKEFIQRLITILLSHYPERLCRALVIAGKGSNGYYNGSTVAGRIALGGVLDAKQTKGKVIFLKRSSDLKEYVSEGELVTIVGGKAPIHPSAFECKHGYY